MNCLQTIYSTLPEWLDKNKTQILIGLLQGVMTAALLSLVAGYWLKIKVVFFLEKDFDRIRLIAINKSRRTLKSVRILIRGFAGHSHPGSTLNTPMFLYSDKKEVILDYSVEQWKGFQKSSDLKDGIYWEIHSEEGSKRGKISKRKLEKLLK